MSSPRRHGWSSSNRKQELPSDWKTRVENVLERDGYRCTWIEDGQRCTETSRLEVDHRVRGPDHSYANLRTLCHQHHGSKTSAEGWDALRKKRAMAKKRAERLYGHQEQHPGKNPTETFTHPWMK